MVEVKYNWPENHKTRLIGKRINRVDGLVKSTGTAKYTYDINLPNQLIVRALGCPHPHCRVISVDDSETKKVPGVVHVHLINAPQPGTEPIEIQTDGQLLVAVAAETEAAAAEGVSKLKVKYELLDIFVDDANLAAAEAKGRTRKAGGNIELDTELGEPADGEDEEAWEKKTLARLFDQSKYVVAIRN